MNGSSAARVSAIGVVTAVLAGMSVAYMPMLLAGVAALAAWVFARPWLRLAIVLVCAFLPFTVGDVGSIPALRVIEFLGPVAAVHGFWSVASGRGDLLPRSSRLYLFAAVAMLAVAGFHLLGTDLGSGIGRLGSAATGLRAYYDILLGPIVFLGTLWIADSAELATYGRRILGVIACVALAAGLLRVGSYYADVPIPFLAGTFDYGVKSHLLAGGTADRIGGLAEASGLGLAALMGLWLTGYRSRLLWPAGTVLTACAVLSGGRTFIVGVVVVVFALPLILRVRLDARSVVAAIVSGALAVVAVVMFGLSQQFRRLVAFAGGLQAQDPARVLVLRFLWIEFVRAPILGKGVGSPGSGIVDRFVAQQVAAGGHSSYLSALANFGLVGGAYLVVFLLGPVISAVARLRREQNSCAAQQNASIAVVAFVAAAGLLLAIRYITGGDGYSDMSPFATAGVATCAVAVCGGAGDEHAA